MTRQHHILAIVMALLALCAARVVAEETPDAKATENAAVVTPMGSGAKATIPTDRRITLNVAKGEISDALRLVAEQGGLNLVIGPEVEGEVSVYLTEASLETALKAIAINNGFMYTVDDGIITVSRPPREPETEPAPELTTRIFTLRSQDADRVRDALEYSLTSYGKIKVLNENSDGLYSSTKLSSLAGDIEDSIDSTGASAATATGDGGTIRHARILVVTDVAENITKIADLIADLDQIPPQVLIEARIVEMSTHLQRELGIDWDINIQASGPILNHQLPLTGRAGFASGSDVQRRPNGSPYNSTGLALGAIDMSAFTALLRVHQQDNAIRILANPRLLVYNNHSASILVGERYPILEANITDEGTLTEAFDTYIPVGVQLEVTPTIMMDSRVSLLVHPVTSSIGDDVVGTTGLRVARILTREIDTRVIMSDGQTVVLGGLIQDRKTRTINKVPGIGDIPILDIFFRQENPTSDRWDLLVFLTAHVESAMTMSERDRVVFSRYRPHFKHIERLQDAPLHFEVPSEFEQPKPMFGDPPPFEEAVMDDHFEGVEPKGKPRERRVPSYEHDSAVDDAGIQAADAATAPRRLKTLEEAVEELRSKGRAKTVKTAGRLPEETEGDL